MIQLPDTSFEFLDKLSAWMRDKFAIKQEEAVYAFRSMYRNQKQNIFFQCAYTMPRDNFDSY